MSNTDRYDRGMDEPEAARRLRAARKARGLSQEQLAKAVGVTKQRVQQIEACGFGGKFTTTDLATWQALAEAVGADLGIGDPPVEPKPGIMVVPEARRPAVRMVLDLDDDEIEPLVLFMRAWGLAPLRDRRRWTRDFAAVLEEEAARTPIQAVESTDGPPKESGSKR